MTLVAWPAAIKGPDGQIFVVIHDRAGVGGSLVAPLHHTVHTTEGTSDEGAGSTFHSNPAEAPHFTFDADDDHIRQMRGLDETAGALRHDPANNPGNPPGKSPNQNCIQYEVVGMSKALPWSSPKKTRDKLLACMAYAAEFHNMRDFYRPRPESIWHRDLSDVTPFPASNNNRRQWMASRYFTLAGGFVLSHMETPWQETTNHWDAGAYDYGAITADAQALREELYGGAPPPPPPPGPGVSRGAALLVEV